MKKIIVLFSLVGFSLCAMDQDSTRAFPVTLPEIPCSLKALALSERTFESAQEAQPEYINILTHMGRVHYALYYLHFGSKDAEDFLTALKSTAPFKKIKDDQSILLAHNNVIAYFNDQLTLIKSRVTNFHQNQHITTVAKSKHLILNLLAAYKELHRQKTDLDSSFGLAGNIYFPHYGHELMQRLGILGADTVRYFNVDSTAFIPYN